MLVAMFSLSKIFSLFDLSRYLDQRLGSAKVLSQKVKLPNDTQRVICLCSGTNV